MALTLTDRLLGGYALFIVGLVLVRGPFAAPGHAGVLAMHALLPVMIWLFRRARSAGPVIRTLHALYPILFLVPFYTAIGFLNDAVGLDRILLNDAVVQRWEEALFGGQVSYSWIRTYPSVLWSAILHFAYFLYYPVILAAPIAVLFRHGPEVAKPVIFVTMVAFVACYLVFVLFPVAGPNYVFPHPVGAVRDVWSAEIVYGLLADGSSVGAAFPSSHVAATVAVVWGLWRAWRGLAVLLILPTSLLTIATVYCQMHYGVDALGGLLVGLAAGAAGQWLWDVWPSSAAAAVTVESPVSTANLPRTSRM